VVRRLPTVYGPLGVSEEEVPAFVSFGCETGGYEGVYFWFFGFVEEGHTCFVGEAATFFGVAFSTGGNEIIPCILTTATSWDDMVYGEVGWASLELAVLALEMVSCEDVSTVEFNLSLRKAVVGEEADNARYGNGELYGVNPVFVCVAVGFFH